MKLYTYIYDKWESSCYWRRARRQATDNWSCIEFVKVEQLHCNVGRGFFIELAMAYEPRATIGSQPLSSWRYKHALQWLRVAIYCMVWCLLLYSTPHVISYVILRIITYLRVKSYARLVLRTLTVVQVLRSSPLIVRRRNTSVLRDITHSFLLWST